MSTFNNWEKITVGECAEDAAPISVVLSEGGKISGNKTGTWEYTQEGKSFIKMTISCISD